MPPPSWCVSEFLSAQRTPPAGVFLHSLLFMAPIGVVFAGLVGWQLTKRALRPMKSLATATRNINIEQLQERLPVRGGGDEVDDVAQAFNDTLARLENSVEQMKQFTASTIRMIAERH